MKKLITLLGIFSAVFVLASCRQDGSTNYEAPSFVGITVDGQTPTTGTELKTFYKERNESTLIEVQLNNPDKLEIRNIYIDGYSYGYSRFTDSSTQDTIFFYLDPGDDLGLIEYSVDDIEFFDGADTKQTVVEANNNRFNVYVFKDVPTVVRENYKLTQESISIDFNIRDNDEVIENSTLTVELFANDERVTYQEVSPGFVSVLFDELLTDKLYEIKVKANYNIDDNTGDKNQVVLFNGTFNTLPTSLPGALISNVEVDSNRIDFDVTYTDDDNVTAESGLKVKLYSGETVVATKTLTGTETGLFFAGLDTSTEYTIKVVADYNLRNGQGLQTDYILAAATQSTLSRSVPVPVIENVEVEQNRILFDVTVEEEDPTNPIIQIDTLVAKVYLEEVVDGTVVKTLERTVQILDDNVDIQIYDVLAGKDIYIELVADYNLYDGNGVQEDQVIHVIEYESLLNLKPIVDVDEVIVTQGYVDVVLNLSDQDNTLKSIVEAHLYEDDGATPVQTVVINTDTEEFVFNHLVQYTKNYRIEIVADYNLRDGQGTQEDVVLYTHALTSLVPKAPAAEVQNKSSHTEGFDFEVIVMDADNTVVSNSLFVQIYKNGVLVDTKPLVIGLNTMSYDIVFGEGDIVLSDNMYDIVIVADYNVFDGSDVQTGQELLKDDISTTAKVLPTAIISNPDSTIDTVIVDIFVTDTDDVIEPGGLVAILTLNGEPVEDVDPVSLVVGNNFDVRFEDVMSDTTFEVEVIVDYDLDNAEGIISDYSLGVLDVTTQVKQEPSAVIDNIETEKESITFDVIVDDVDNVIVPGTTKAVLYINDTPTAHETLLNVGLNAAVEFTGVYSNQEFNIRVITDYDLNDGLNSVEDELLVYDFATTKPNAVVVGSIYTVTTGIDTLTFNAIITDTDLVSTTNLKAILLLDGVDTGEFINLNIGDNQNLQFDELVSDSEYTIRIVTDYNLRDIIGDRFGLILDSYKTNTDDYSVPTGSVTETDEEIDSITFNTVINDSDNTSTGDYTVVLYKDGLPVGGKSEIISEGVTNLIEFDGLLSGVQYELRMFATYDLHDGDGEQANQQIYSRFVETLSRKVPVGNATDVSVTGGEVSFLFDFTDVDDTLVHNSFVAKLYDRDNVLVSSKNLYAEEVSFDVSALPADYQVTICITASYNLSDGEGVVQGDILCQEVTTKANQKPIVDITNVQINQDTVDVTFDFEDPSNVIVGDTYAILKDSSDVVVDSILVTPGDDVTITFSGHINARELYYITFESEYDLRDTFGVRDEDNEEVIYEYALMSFGDLVPQAHIFNVVTTVDSITFDVTIVDNDTTYLGNARVALFKDGVEVDTQALIIGTQNGLVFDNTGAGLVSNTEYELRVFVDYDLSDGNGAQNGILLDSELISTDAKEVITAEISDLVQTSDDVTFNVTVTDNSDVLEGNLKAILLKNNVPLGVNYETALSVGSNVGVTFVGSLLSNNEYSIQIVADYDLDDDTVLVTDAVLDIEVFATTINDVPRAQFTGITSDKTSITFSVNVTDTDSTVDSNLEAILYLEGIEVDSMSLVVGANADKVFDTDILSDSNYSISIETDYDLDDGTGVKADYVLASTTRSTTAKGLPEGYLGNFIVDYDSITFDSVIIDTDSVIDYLTLKAVLYENSIPTGDTIDLELGTNLADSFTNLKSDRIYEVRIETNYNLNDGSGDEVGYEMDAVLQTTVVKGIPSAAISNVTSTNTKITFDVALTDNASTIQGNATAVLYKDGVADSGYTPINLSVGDNTSLEFDNLVMGQEYDIKIFTDYNLNVGTADITAYEMTQNLISTKALLYFENITLDPLNVNFDIVADDQFDILYDDYVQYKVMLIEDEVTETQVGETQSINIGVEANNTSVDILNYYNNQLYRVDVYARIKDGLGGYTDELVYTYELEVPKKQVQAISISEVYFVGNSISTSVFITLPDTENDLIDSGQAVNAVLYEGVDLGGGVIEFQAKETIALVDGSQAVNFTYSATNTLQYMIAVEGTVDFNELDGSPVSGYKLAQRTFVYTIDN